MNLYEMNLHHIGYAVRDINAAKSAFSNLGYSACGELFSDKARNVNILFMAIKISSEVYKNQIELITVLDENKPSPVTNMLKKQSAIMYHPCYVSNDITLDIERLTKTGFHLLHDIAPAPAISETAKVAFVYSVDIGLFELVEL